MVTLIKLNSGKTIPAVGLGVWQSGAGDETYQGVLSALKLGYRHIDTAQIYGNEADVGKAVRECGIPRSDIWVTSKVWIKNWGYDVALQSVKATLARMGLDYVDMMLLHAPGDASSRADTWRALEDAQKQGLVHDIGVSNFGAAHIEKLLKTATVTPAVNQIELSPFLQRSDLVDFCKTKGIALQAYSPLGRGTKLADPTITKIASKYGKSPAQILVKWSLLKGFIPLPKSVNPVRQAQNIDVFDFELDEQDVAALDGLEEGLITGWDPITQHEV